MRFSTATEPGYPATPNQDWVFANHGIVIVLDGATAPTETGCVHGVSWFANQLGLAIARLAFHRTADLSEVLGNAIAFTADAHRDCDLHHPGTPSAAAAIVRVNEATLDYLVLGDVTVIVDTTEGTRVLDDDRIDAVTQAERTLANRYPFGTAEKQDALRIMKHAGLTRRNQPGGFWVAAAEPTVAAQAIRGLVQRDVVKAVAVLTDGAARIATLFGRLEWHGILKVLDRAGPAELIRLVREVEASDPVGTKWPRNKPSSDATVVFVR